MWRALLTTMRTWFFTYTDLAKGHRLRPMTAFSIHSRVAAMTSSWFMLRAFSADSFEGCHFALIMSRFH